jgi:hypothetical protein
MITLYRNVGRKWHVQGSDWIRRGITLCERPLPRPGFVINLGQSEFPIAGTTQGDPIRDLLYASDLQAIRTKTCRQCLARLARLAGGQ